MDVDDAKGFEQAIVIDEGASGVALRTRLVVRRQTPAGYYWETFDSEDGDGKHDPLQRLAGGLDFDAQELIASIPKIDLVTGERGAAQAYLLTDGQGDRVEEASARIVVDSSSRIPVIRTPGSCIRCHATGLLDLPRNLVRGLVSDGVEIDSKDKRQAEGIERLYLGRLDKELNRNQEDFATFVASVCDLSSTEVTKAYAELLTFYEAKIKLEHVAVELGASDADELQSAIAYYAEIQGTVPPRLACSPTAKTFLAACGRRRSIPVPMPRRVYGRSDHDFLCDLDIRRSTGRSDARRGTYGSRSGRRARS